MGFLPIKELTELFDFERQNVQDNWQFGLIKTPHVKTLTWQFKYPTGGVITRFDAIRVNVKDSYLTELQTYDLTSDVVIDRVVDGSWTWYYCQTQDIDSIILPNGLYYLKISDGIFTVKSELFYVNSALTIKVYLANASGGHFENVSGGGLYHYK